MPTSHKNDKAVNLFDALPMKSFTTLPWIAFILICGCGDGRASVSGKVTLTDGTPVGGARVTARNDETGAWATGITTAEGEYSLGTQKSGDGIPAGKYYVIVLENSNNFDNPQPRIFHAKYEMAKTSGLSLELESGERKVMDIELEPPRRH
ncbi:MAG: carboxypeptidase-like regulatory domain-containing protein [Pirellulaceae bacterium]|nr:carboxypeptidase regulatory-like domain-containing protein [Planctomycetales bacterium]